MSDMTPETLFPKTYEDLCFENTALKLRLAEAEKALRIADVHVGWGDCTLENVHNIIRAALAAKSPTPKPPAPEPHILTTAWPAGKGP